MSDRPPIYGLLAEFDDLPSLVAAARRMRDEGYTHTDAFSPFPVHELSDAIGMRPTRLPLYVLIGGVVGCVAGYAMQYYASVIDYPINIGGRPLHSWPMFVPITFEVTILFAALTAVLGMLALNGLPQPYHPLFHHPRFAQATRDRFFLAVEATDPKFDLLATRDLLASLNPREVTEVPH